MNRQGTMSVLNPDHEKHQPNQAKTLMTTRVANYLWRRLTRFTLRSLLVVMVLASLGLA